MSNLQTAVMNEDLNMIKEKIKTSSALDINSSLFMAANAGYKEVVEMLIPVSDPRRRNSEALIRASENGHKEIVEMLIPVSDPMASNSEALRLAASAGHKEVVELLIPVSDYNQVFQSFERKRNHHLYHLYYHGLLDFLAKAIGKHEAGKITRELQASTVQIPHSLNRCIDQAKSESQGTVQVPKAQARRL